MGELVETGLPENNSELDAKQLEVDRRILLILQDPINWCKVEDV
jgi:hypothetical protein